jgi:uncharacterized protein (DUF1501 family)
MIATTEPIQLSGDGDQRRTLIVVFLRGAADGLSLVAPLTDDNYYQARPYLGIKPADAVKLDGFFGLHPLLKPLQQPYQEGQLAIIHAAGSEDTTRSHFEAQDLMEHGGIASGGWLGRFLRYGSPTAASALAAIAAGSVIPEALRGAPAVTPLQSFEQFTLGTNVAGLTQQLRRLYAAQQGALAAAGRTTLAALERLEKLRGATYHPDHEAIYTDDDFAQRLQQIAQLIKARVGLEVATVDLGGWDSHFTQNVIIEPLMQRLALGLRAFYQDMGAAMAEVSVVVMTEFGRRVQENSSFGTDHGRGSVMFVLGGGVKGGRVVGRWPGLHRDMLEGPGDLAVVHNYRNVLAPVLRRHGVARQLDVVFPNFQLEEMDI